MCVKKTYIYIYIHIYIYIYIYRERERERENYTHTHKVLGAELEHAQWQPALPRSSSHSASPASNCLCGDSTMISPTIISEKPLNFKKMIEVFLSAKSDFEIHWFLFLKL